MQRARKVHTRERQRKIGEGKEGEAGAVRWALVGGKVARETTCALLPTWKLECCASVSAWTKQGVVRVGAAEERVCVRVCVRVCLLYERI